MDKHLFADVSHAEKYASKRPQVPAVVADIIVDFIKEFKPNPVHEKTATAFIISFHDFVKTIYDING